MYAVLALGLALWPAEPAAAQQRRYYFVEMATPYGPMGVGYSALPADQRASGHTHEVVAAHPIWAYGVIRATYSMDCSTGSYRGSAGMLPWSDGPHGHLSAASVESRIENPLAQVFGSHDRKRDLLKAIICRSGPLQLSPVETFWGQLLTWLKPFGGSAREPWPIRTFREVINPFEPAPADRASMRFALWGDDGSSEISGSRLAGGTSLIDLEAPWGRGDTFTVGMQRFRVEPGFSARDLMNYMVREEIGDQLVRRFDIKTTSPYLLTQVFATVGDGLGYVGHMLVCQNRPDLAYAASATYRSLEEQQVALRFVNGISVDCP